MTFEKPDSLGRWKQSMAIHLSKKVSYHSHTVSHTVTGQLPGRWGGGRGCTLGATPHLAGLGQKKGERKRGQVLGMWLCGVVPAAGMRLAMVRSAETILTP